MTESKEEKPQQQKGNKGDESIDAMSQGSGLRSQETSGPSDLGRHALCGRGDPLRHEPAERIACGDDDCFMNETDDKEAGFSETRINENNSVEGPMLEPSAADMERRALLLEEENARLRRDMNAILSRLNDLEGRPAHRDSGRDDRDDASVTVSEYNVRKLRCALPVLGFSAASLGVNDGCDTEKLPDDSFSFWAISNFRGTPFLSALAVFSVQTFTYILLLLSMIDFGSSKNPLGIPASVEVAVRGSQLCAVFITALTMDDLRTGMVLLNKGFHRDTEGRAFQHATWLKWAAMVFARIAEGALGLLASFFLIVRAETVMDLLLNFTAMGFLSQLDEIFFALAVQGFVDFFNCWREGGGEKRVTTRIKYGCARHRFPNKLHQLLHRSPSRYRLSPAFHFLELSRVTSVWNLDVSGFRLRVQELVQVNESRTVGYGGIQSVYPTHPTTMPLTAILVGYASVVLPGTLPGEMRETCIQK